jgi:hypothetical protein
MKNPIDPIQLQRLIDGECSAEDLRTLLLTARAEPKSWEEIGLALLEDRAFQQQLKTHACEPASSTLHAVSPVVSLSELSELEPGSISAGADTLEPAKSPCLSNAADTRAEMSSYPMAEVRLGSEFHSVWKSWLTMAASLLAVAVLGYSIGQQNSATTPPPYVAQQPSGVDRSGSWAAKPGPPQTTLASLEPEYRMELSEHHRLLPNGEVPLYVVKSLDQWEKLDRTLPDGLRFTPEELAELNLQGIGVHKELDMLTGNLADGRTFLVPIRSIRFSPVQ